MENSQKSLGCNYKISQNRLKAKNKIWKEQAITLFPDIAKPWSTPKRPAWQFPNLSTPAVLSPSPGRPAPAQKTGSAAKGTNFQKKRPSPPKTNCAGLKAPDSLIHPSIHPSLLPKWDGGSRQLLPPWWVPSPWNSAWEEPPLPPREQLRPAYPHCALGYPALAIVSARNRYLPRKDRDEEKEAQVLRGAPFKCLPHRAHLPSFLRGNLPRLPPKFSGN